MSSTQKYRRCRNKTSQVINLECLSQTVGGGNRSPTGSPTRWSCKCWNSSIRVSGCINNVSQTVGIVYQIVVSGESKSKQWSLSCRCGRRSYSREKCIKGWYRATCCGCRAAEECCLWQFVLLKQCGIRCRT